MKNIVQKFLLCTIFTSFTLSGCATTQKEYTPPKVKVAVLMPLSGKNGVTGKRLTSLIELGLEDGLQGNIKLTKYDAANEEAAIVMINKIKDSGTEIVLGPLLSDDTKIVAPYIQNTDISLITLSNNPALAGDNIYVFGHAPLRQTERIINYCLDKGHRDIILLLPENSYSVTLGKIIENMSLKANASPVKVEYYKNEPESVALAVERVEQIVDRLNEIDDNTKPVIYVADDVKMLELLFNSIKTRNLDQKALLVGDNRSDIYFPEGVNLIFTGSLNYLNYNLDKQAAELLQIYHLNPIDLMAYDLGRMVARYIGQGSTREKFVARLRSNEEYVGASGSIMFDDNIAKRKYDIIERTRDGAYRTIEL